MGITQDTLNVLLFWKWWIVVVTKWRYIQACWWLPNSKLVWNWIHVQGNNCQNVFLSLENRIILYRRIWEAKFIFEEDRFKFVTGVFVQKNYQRVRNVSHNWKMTDKTCRVYTLASTPKSFWRLTNVQDNELLLLFYIWFL